MLNRKNASQASAFKISFERKVKRKGIHLSATTWIISTVKIEEQLTIKIHNPTPWIEIQDNIKDNVYCLFREKYLDPIKYPSSDQM